MVVALKIKKIDLIKKVDFKLQKLTQNTGMIGILKFGMNYLQKWMNSLTASVLEIVQIQSPKQILRHDKVKHDKKMSTHQTIPPPIPSSLMN